MEIETVPENIRENHKSNEVLKSHPVSHFSFYYFNHAKFLISVTKRVEKEKLDTVWEYFRPFSTKREQRVNNSNERIHT
jgi:ureidoglycolate hydrolase